MNKESMKKMVILKDLPSNIVDEAIVILKPNVKLKGLNIEKNKKFEAKENNCSKKYIVNEAQMVISNYLSNIENCKKNDFLINKKIDNKYKIYKIISILLGVTLILSLIIS